MTYLQILRERRDAVSFCIKHIPSAYEQQDRRNLLCHLDNLIEIYSRSNVELHGVEDPFLGNDIDLVVNRYWGRTRALTKINS
jgi:hypothetical protein